MLPVVTISWLGVYWVTNQKQALTAQLTQLIDQQLTTVISDVNTAITNTENQLLTALQVPDYDPWILRREIHQQAHIDQLLILNQNKKIVFPPRNMPLSQAESLFLKRISHFIEEMRFPTEAEEGATKSKLYQSTGAKTDLFAEGASLSRHGWRVWYWESGINLLFWKKSNDHHLIVAEIPRIRLLADVVAALPHQHANDHLITLTDSHDRVIYQWGATQLKKDQFKYTKSLDYPLNAWQLHYYSKTNLLNNPYWFLPAIIAILAVIILTLILAVFFYREHNREMTEAGQRVNFVNQVSHELKTPLTNIRMYAELLDEEIDDDDIDLKQRLQVIIAETHRLSRLILNVLNFSRKQRNIIKIYPKPGIIDEVIQNVLHHFELSLAEKGFIINFNGKAGNLVYFDHDHVEQMIGNLISNVEKYARSGQYLGVISTYQNQVTTIRIEDKGPGIPPDQRQKIFQPFYRVSNKLNDGITGAGIGLSITRDLARQHDGDIFLESTTTGSIFIIQLKTPENSANL